MRKMIIAVLFVAQSAIAATDPARAALDRGDFDVAIAGYEKAVAAAPDNAQAHYWLGVAHGRRAQKVGLFGGMSSIRTAKAEWLRAIELDPDYFEARLRLIEFYTVAPALAGG